MNGAVIGYHEAYYILEELNDGVERGTEPPNLQTPQATVEHFVRACRKSRHLDASWAINLNLFPIKDRMRLAQELPPKLLYLIDQQIGIPWDSLPDRPDGITSEPQLRPKNEAPSPRRSIRLGAIEMDGRDYVFRLQRVKVHDEAPIWVFAAGTVDDVPRLYERFGPSWLARSLPEWAKEELFGDMPIGLWIALFLLLLLSLGFGFAVQQIAWRFLQRSERPWVRGLGHTLLVPIAAVAMISLDYGVARGGLSLTGDYAHYIHTTLLVLLILAFTWLCMRGIKYVSIYVFERYVDGLESGDPDAQRYMTYVSVLRRVLIMAIVITGFGVLLSQFRILQAFGLSLLASAGVASVILGIAAQSTLGNIIAGIQIALTGPVRIGDNVHYEGNWGWVEEINYTYLTIRTWDHRRLVVPLKYIIDHPLQNWTKRDPHLVKPIEINCDYTVDVQAAREHFEALARDHEDWDDTEEPRVEVIEAKESTIVLRFLVSAGDPLTAWSLSCELREKLIRYLVTEQRQRSMPRERLELVAEVPRSEPTPTPEPTPEPEPEPEPEPTPEEEDVEEAQRDSEAAAKAAEKT